MRTIVQRVAAARVTVDGETVGQIAAGLLVLLGVAPEDGPAEVRWMADKIATLRIFEDADGKMNRSVRDIGGGILVVSQFTLYGDVSRGRRPSFIGAARPEHAEPLYLALARELDAQTGRFGAHMSVELTNDGPVTLLLDSPTRATSSPPPVSP